MNILGSNYLAIEMPNLTRGGRWAESRTCVIIPLGVGVGMTAAAVGTKKDWYRPALNCTVSFVWLCLYFQRNTNTIWFHSHLEPKKQNELTSKIETDP